MQGFGLEQISLMNHVVYFIKNRLKEILFRVIRPNTFSQAGEDVIMKFLFDGKGVSNPSFLDLGTNQPNWGNNTYLFYLGGSRGVCVEADPGLIDEIIRIRPHDKVLHGGISVESGDDAEFFVFDEPAINTFDKTEARARAQSGLHRIVRTIKVRLRTIEEVISENFQKFPDILSIDIEGLDFAVLRSLDLARFPIPVICVETCTYSESHIKKKDRSIFDYMENSGYFVYADTYVNTIFVNLEWFESTLGHPPKAFIRRQTLNQLK